LGIYAGADFAYYFGSKRKKKGISAGVSYSGFKADYEVNEPIMYTYKSTDSRDTLRRRITIDSLKERVNYNIFNFPVMYSYRWFFGNKNRPKELWNKSIFNIKAGPSLMVLNTKSEYNANISFEGLYQIDTILGNRITYYDTFRVSSYNLFFTTEELENLALGITAQDVFDELRRANPNYDFADSKNFRGKQKNGSRITVGINLAFNMQYQISNKWAIRAGAHAMYAPLPALKEKYIPIDRTTDPYNSIYNSSAKTSYTAFGLNAGLVCNF
jgi:hypothetical protein